MTMKIIKLSDIHDGHTLPNGVIVYKIGFFSELNPEGKNDYYFWSCCFGFIDNELILGDTHHALILKELIEERGASLEGLMKAKQKWGWARYYKNTNTMDLAFTTDDALQTEDSDYTELCKESFKEYFKVPVEINEMVGEGYTTQENYGQRYKNQYTDEGWEYCEGCGEYYDPGDEEDHYKKCHGCEEYYHPCIYYDAEEHETPYCNECGEHIQVHSLDKHNDEYHNEEEEERLGSWKETLPKVIIYNVDLNDDRVFAKIAVDYIKNAQIGETRLGEDLTGLVKAEEAGSKNNWMTYEDIAKEYDKANGTSLYRGMDNDDSSNSDLTGQNSDLSASPEEAASSTSQIDDPKVLDIYKDWDSKEYRWSYDGRQLHMWRVYNRSAYGPSHYDMFGYEGYDVHSQGRVYVSPDGKVGVLYWQINHPECEKVLNEWCMKTFGHMPDYVYRAYGPYAGEVRSRWDFPIVEVSGLPIKPSERWWEMPGGKPGWGTSKGITIKDYPAKSKKKNLPGFGIYPESVPGPVDNSGQPVNPLKKKKRRERKRNRQYRNRSFRRR